MKKFTKKQRNIIYKKVLNNFNPDGGVAGLCWDINRCINRKKIWRINSTLTQKVFSELGLFEHYGTWMGYFWKRHENDERFLALCLMIEMTK